MPRGAPSQADAELLAELAAADVDWVTPTTLERWRLAKLLPPPERRWLGRGRGSVSAYPGGAVEIATVLAEHTRQGRSRHYGAVALFVSELPVGEDVLKDALCWFLRRDRLRTERNVARDDEALYKRADRLRRQRHPQFALAVYGMADDPEHPTRRERSKQSERRRALGEAAGLGYVVSHEQPEEIFPDQLLAGLEALQMSDVDLSEIGELLGNSECFSGIPLFLQPGTPESLARLRAMTFEQLNEARTVTKTLGAMTAMVLFSSLLYAGAKSTLRAMSSGFPVSLIVPLWLRPTDANTLALIVHYWAVSPGMVEVLREWVDRLTEAVVPWMVNSTGQFAIRGALQPPPPDDDEIREGMAQAIMAALTDDPEPLLPWGRARLDEILGPPRLPVRT